MARHCNPEHGEYVQRLRRVDTSIRLNGASVGSLSDAHDHALLSYGVAYDQEKVYSTLVIAIVGAGCNGSVSSI